MSRKEEGQAPPYGLYFRGVPCCSASLKSHPRIFKYNKKLDAPVRREREEAEKNDTEMGEVEGVCFHIGLIGEGGETTEEQKCVYTYFPHQGVHFLFSQLDIFKRKPIILVWQVDPLGREFENPFGDKPEHQEKECGDALHEIEIRLFGGPVVGFSVLSVMDGHLVGQSGVAHDVE